MGRNTRRISRNVSQIALSAIKEMAMRSAEVEGAVSLSWGLPSFRTPAHIRRAVAQGLRDDADIGKYSLPDGLESLRGTVARHHLGRWGVEADPGRNVVVTAGNMQGMNAVLHTLLDPGDEVVVTDPGFASHFQQIRLCGGVPVPWPLDEANGWTLDVGLLDEIVTERTKAVVLVTPSNPTGAIFPEHELDRVGEIARERGLLILLDDPYSPFTYENKREYFNLGSRADLAEHVVYMFTFSKAYAMSGWRLGYMILPGELKAQMLKVHDATIICAPRISQVAGMAALSEEPRHLAEFEATLRRRRDLICRRLSELPHVFRYVEPQGAYYVFPRIVCPHEDSLAFSLSLLQRARVAVTPGAAFGPTGEHHVRMAYCVSEETIDAAFDRITALYGRA